MHKYEPVSPTAISCSHIFKGKFSSLEKFLSEVASTFGLLAALLTNPSIFPKRSIKKLALPSIAFSFVISIAKPIESTFIDFPILIKYKSERYNNFRTYLLGGIKYGIDIASQKDIDDEGQKLVKLKKNDLGIEIGFGMDFYLEYFKFSPQIKLTYGILNLLSEDETVYTKSVSKLTTNSWMLSFTFE